VLIDCTGDDSYAELETTNGLPLRVVSGVPVLTTPELRPYEAC